MRTDLRDEEEKANRRLAELTGICPKCADEGWWIDDDLSDGGTGFHYCTCAAGAKVKEEDGEGG
jgi:hypothetical protein